MRHLLLGIQDNEEGSDDRGFPGDCIGWRRLRGAGTSPIHIQINIQNHRPNESDGGPCAKDSQVEIAPIEIDDPLSPTSCGGFVPDDYDAIHLVPVSK